MNEPNERDEPEQLADLCIALGITVECKEGARGPRIEALGDKPWKADGWTVTLHFAGRTHVTDYWCGIGHREIGRDAKDAQGQTLARVPFVANPRASEGWRRFPEDGEALRDALHARRVTLWEIEHAWYRPKPPSVADVLGSLLSDAQCAANARNFDDFASDLGYDPDSRTAERVYNACIVIFRDMHNFCGEHYERLSRAEH